MKTLLLSLAILFALAGCASSTGGSNFDTTEDTTMMHPGG